MISLLFWTIAVSVILSLVILQVMLGCALLYGVQYLAKAAVSDYHSLVDETKRTINKIKGE